MIVGVGHDLVSMTRIRRVLSRWGQRMQQRTFSDAECAYCESKKDPAMHYAARFAAKEACYKALSNGRPLGLWFRDFEVANNASGGPCLQLSARAQHIAEQAQVGRIHLSLSHDGDYASAFVVLESKVGAVLSLSSEA